VKRRTIRIVHTVEISTDARLCDDCDHFNAEGGWCLFFDEPTSLGLRIDECIEAETRGHTC
jgi:hypothetical protein